MSRALPTLLLLLPACRSPDSAAVDAETSGDPPEVAIADRVMEKMGGRAAWDATRCVTWHFMGRRRLVWDKRTGDLRVESGEHVCLMNLDTREGRAFEKGVEVQDEAARRTALDKGYAAFINDSYWMFMPYKLRDPGVRLAYFGEGRTKAGNAADLLEMTFEDVGLTPKNRYVVYVGRDTGLVEQWDFYLDRADEAPRLSTPWNGWKRFGGILLCTDHGDGKDWEIAVLDDPPRSAFESPAPVELP